MAIDSNQTHADATQPNTIQQPRLNASALHFSIDSAQILNDVSIQVMPGELIGLIGPNGAGKSTLLSLLAGLSTPSSGNVMLDQQPMSTLTAASRAKKIGWLEQIGHIHWPLSVRRLVSLGRFPHLSPWQKTSDKDEQAIQTALEQTNSTHLQDRDAMTLSGGERARVLLARVLAAQPSLLLADEPVSSLDLAHQLQTMNVLRQFAQENQSCIVVLHDLSLAARYCDRLYLMHQGRVMAEGNAAAVLSNDNIREVYGVEVIAGCESIPWIVPHKIVDPSSL